MGRDQPKSIQDGPYGLDSGTPSNFEGPSGLPQEMTETMAVKLGRECWEASTNWLNSGRRAAWNDSLRAFQGKHPAGSKYLQADYKYRSRFFRPKSRAMVRRAEAQTAAAFFSNEDVVSIQAEDDDDPKQEASAEIMKHLLQYRLTKTIPWFQTLVGARQDAEVMGICIGKAYWRFSETFDRNEGGFDLYKRREDHPWVDLIAPENFRFDAGADWRNPVATSPYLIEMVPMYVADVRAKMASGEWFEVAESALLGTSDMEDDVTRRSREQGRVPGKDQDSWKPREFDICWVRENVIRYSGRDWHYFSLASAGELLSAPRPVEEVYLHGVRPWVVGCVVLEAHKTYPTSKVELVSELQRAANETWNLRFDNVKLALNPRQFVNTGQGFEPQDLRTFMPGKVVFGKNPKDNVVWDRPPEVTQSSYEEQDRINVDFDELAGDFSAATMAAGQNPVVPETVGGMQHMAGPSASMNEYELRLFAETFVDPIIRQLVKLEQAYETDPIILALAGDKAQLFEKFGMDSITDELLNQELTVRVNVGMGSTNPATRGAKFSGAVGLLAQIFGQSLAQGLNFEEVAKEVASFAGYKDGKRFFKPDFDPRVAQLQQQLQDAQQKLSKAHLPDPMEQALRQAEAAKDAAEVRYRAQNDAGHLQLD